LSHVVCSPVIITDLDCLWEALKAFPKIKVLHQDTYHWYGSWVKDYHQPDAAYKNGIDPKDYGKCAFALHMEGVTYEAGVCKRRDGKGYSIVWDFYSDGRTLSTYLGKGAEKLMVEYQKQFIKKHAHAEGLTFTMEENADEVTIEMELQEAQW
jgi:hypothetical protein